MRCSVVLDAIRGGREVMSTQLPLTQNVWFLGNVRCNKNDYFIFVTQS